MIAGIGLSGGSSYWLVAVNRATIRWRVPAAWSCGLYPTSHRGLRAEGTAKSFDKARCIRDGIA